MPLITADVRHAARRLTATPLLSLGAILILALGIGSAVVMTDVLDLVLMRPPAHVTNPERLARIYIGTGELTTYGSYDALATLHDELEGTAVYFSEFLTLGRGERARRVDVIAHTPEYFSVLGVQPALGAFLDAGNPAREDTAVISHALWQREFGGAPDILGTPLRLGTDSFTIVGVAPRGFAGLGYKAADVWLPFLPRARAGYGADPSQWQSAMFLFIVARLRPGVNREVASEHATAAYRAAMPPYARKARVVLGDIRASRAPGAQAGSRVEVPSLACRCSSC